MPTYQRIIKKQRLKEIRKFIDNKGFFPNSLIISIDTNGKKLRFDLATPQIEKLFLVLAFFTCLNCIALFILLMDSTVCTDMLTLRTQGRIPFQWLLLLI